MPDSFKKSTVREYFESIVIAVILAALSLTLDFAFIEGCVDRGAPKFMEWYAGYGLMVTLIWLYITLLRLLALVARNQ